MQLSMCCKYSLAVIVYLSFVVSVEAGVQGEGGANTNLQSTEHFLLHGECFAVGAASAHIRTGLKTRTV